MKVGTLDQQVIPVSAVQANVGGEMTTTYTNLDPVFATVISQKGREAFEAARTNARSMIRVGMHYRADVQNTWRLIWEGNTYNVIDTDRSERKGGMLWLTAESVGAM